MADSHGISLEMAARMTQAYRDAGINVVKASAFSREAFERLLAQEGCEGIRCYYAFKLLSIDPELDQNLDGHLTLVMVGTDREGNDIYNGELAEMSYCCPYVCPQDNPLNSDL
jgi:hypothetical protein